MSIIKLYDKSHTYKGDLNSAVNYKDLKIVSDVSSGDKTLTFTLLDGDLELEGYIRTKDDEFVIKQIDRDLITCALNLEDLEKTAFKTFSVTDVTIDSAARTALAGTGWTVNPCDITKKRNAGILKKNSLGIINDLCVAFMCEVIYDTLHKTITFVEQRGSDKGVYFRSDLNLKRLTDRRGSYDLFTKIIPYGADDLTIEEVNDGKNYLENHQYTNKEKTYIWTDTSYTDAQALKDDALAKLADMSRPTVSYAVEILNLAKLNPDYALLDFDLGDTIKIVDNESHTIEKQRIVKLTRYPDSPEKDTCELSNTFLTWEQMQSKLQQAAQIVNAVISPDGTYDGIVKVSDILHWNDEISNAVEKSDYIKDYVQTTDGRLGLVEASIGDLVVNYLKADFANLNVADIDVAKIGELYSKSGIVEGLVVKDGHITGTLSGVTINGDLINANTLKADKIVMKGSDGLYYALNTNGESVTSEQTEYNALDGSNIIAQTIDASKINVSDLNAFGATIGGFRIDADAIKSILKNAFDDNIEGLYLGSDGKLMAGTASGDHLSYDGENVDIKTEWLEFDKSSKALRIKNEGNVKGNASFIIFPNGQIKMDMETPWFEYVLHNREETNSDNDIILRFESSGLSVLKRDSGKKADLSVSGTIFSRGESLVYKKGDSVNLSGALAMGYLTSGGTNIQLAFTLDKPLASDITGVSYNNLKMSFRNNGVYLIGDSNGINVPTAGQITVNYVALRNANQVRISLTLPTAKSGSLNNAPVGTEILTGTLTFT